MITAAIAFVVGVFAGGFGGYKIGAKAKAKIEAALKDAEAIIARIKR